MLKPVIYSWLDFDEIITNLAAGEKVKSVLEIGAGAKPFFTDQQLEIFNVDYTILDINKQELEKATISNATRLVHDLNIHPLSQQFDLIFSQMLLEHLPDPESFHRNLLHMMEPGGVICHFFATKYGLPSLLNVILPSRLSDYVVYKLQKRNPDQEGKFKAYYRKCTGPLKSTCRWFESIGFDVITYNGYLGHSYLGRIKWLNKIEKFYCSIILKINNPYFSSNAILVMKKKRNSP